MMRTLALSCVALLMANGAAADTNARILLTDDGDLLECYTPGPCDELSADFPVGFFTFAMTLNGVSEVSRVFYGVAWGLATHNFMIEECQGSIQYISGSAGTVAGLDWTPEEPCAKLTSGFLRMGNIRTSSMWATEMTIVDHPLWGPPTIVDCDGVEWQIPVENLGIVGVGMSGYVPCADTVPVEQRSWAQVKARYRGE